ncbi:PAS domain-containing protein [Methylobacterium oryzisoli]|uniref:PAS domain-containing protein n=1 Tax=Methylobacterium oryzisoli TaxID=3385502 RepID=UPI003891A9F6
MVILDLFRSVLDEAPVAIVVTDAVVERPGPTILYANTAFGRLTGRAPCDVIGLTPRFMHGRDTRRAVLDQFAIALKACERFHGFLTNYRADGSRYVVEIDCRPLTDTSGRLTNFIAFEREVVRRRGRPAVGASGRFEPVEESHDSLTTILPGMNLFKS